MGVKVVEGNLITLEYLSSSGDDANGGSTFTLADAISYGGTDATTTNTVTASSAGGVSTPESISSIKYNAPKSFKTQDRAVTKNDYKSIILNKYSNASSIITWGGEDNDPVDYGKVYISIKPITGFTLTDVAKDDIKTILEKYKVLAIEPVIVDPDYTFITTDTTVYWNSSISANSDTIKGLAISTTKDYSTNYLGKFESAFRHSQLTGKIDDADSSVRSNVTKIKLKKRIKPTLNIFQGYSGNDAIKYNSALIQGTFVSDYIDVCTTYINVRLKDDSSGNINLVDSSDATVQSNIGTIDYATGKVTVNSLKITRIVSGESYVYMIVDIEETDVKASTNQVLSILDADITVSVVEDVT
jgi:hypothetical protein